MLKASSLGFTSLFWVACLIVGVLVLSVEAGHAHEDVSRTSDVISASHDPMDHAKGAIGHCHGGASCGVPAILILADELHFNIPSGRALCVLHQGLSNLVTHVFEPPPPRNLS